VILILTCPVDLHADAVQVHLDRMGVEYTRLNTADLGKPGYLVEAHLLVPGGGYVGRLGDIALEDITCVWHRRPTEFLGDPDDVAELRAGVGGVLATLQHLNDPAAMAAAHKPRQLVLAARCGLNVPVTLITTDPASAEVFAADRDHGAVVKPMSRRVAGLINGADRSGWARAIHLTQARIDKSHDVRLTTADDEWHATAIRSPHLDWRVDLGKCDYEPLDDEAVPREVQVGIIGLMRKLRLRYGALDFAVDRSGRWWFLEVNPNGQWLWLEEATGQPISEVVARALRRRHPWAIY
jgi:hypothetical protein